MDATDFTEIIENPQKLQEIEPAELKQLAADYPYSQIVQFLYAMKLKGSGEHLFNQQLGRTSILTNDRTILYDVFEREYAAQPEDLNKEPKTEKAQESNPSGKAESRSADIIFAETASSITPPAEKPETPEIIEEKVDADKDLPAAERIKKILEKNRSLRREFEEKKIERTSEMSERIKAILQKQRALQSEQSGEKSEDTNQIIKDKPEERRTQEEVSPQKEEMHASLINEPANNIAEKSEVDIEEGNSIIKSETVEEAKTSDTDTSPGESHSFTDWLRKYSESLSAEPEKDEAGEEKLNFETKARLIDSFVEKLPLLKNRGKEQREAPAPKIHMGNISQDDEGALVTETLARVYIKQGHLEKAIKAYRILKLKYPEKSSFFADQILEINKLKNSK